MRAKPPIARTLNDHMRTKPPLAWTLPAAPSNLTPSCALLM